MAIKLAKTLPGAATAITLSKAIRLATKFCLFSRFLIMEEVILYNSPLGTIQIIGTAEHLHSVSFLDTPTYIQTGETLPHSQVLKNCIEQLDHYFSGKNLHFNLPLQQTGTAFQEAVWDALLSIKPGSTTSYLQLSKLLNNVKAIRAVGAANGKNNIAIIVPCHRVIGSNGDLIGYAGSLWRKQWLLAHEAKHLNGVQTLF
jgi:methylated-DNA-[protein]-cysteine S-methyltransferase